MEWLQSLSKGIDFIEDNLENPDLNADYVSREVAVSSFYFQKGFTILTGYSMGEYIRNRKLYLAAIEIANGAKVIDAALRYGWETPESFTKAFTRFHGTTPQSVKGDTSRIKVFLPLKITVSITGGSKMDYTIEKMNAFKLIGFKKEFNMENSYREIPKFWTEVYQNHVLTWCGKGTPRTPTEIAVKNYGIGQYGVCIETKKNSGTFDYLVAGNYNGTEVPDGLYVEEIPALTWAKFTCTGPMPGALQSVNTEIFNNWLPTNGKYKISADLNIEWYSDEGSQDDADYRSEIWIPVEEI